MAWPTATAARIPGARISFVPDPELQPVLDRMFRPLDDVNARREWGWQPAYELDRTIDDVVRAVQGDVAPTAIAQPAH